MVEVVRTNFPPIFSDFEFFSVHNVSPLRGEKLKNRPVSKNNTGRAALRAVPVANNYKEITSDSKPRFMNICMVLAFFWVAFCPVAFCPYTLRIIIYY